MAPKPLEDLMNVHWEKNSGIGSYFSTLKEIMINPSQFFSEIEDKETFGRAFLFALLSILIYGTASTIWSFLFESMSLGFKFMEHTASARNLGPAELLALPITHIAMLFLIPIFGIIGSFIGAGITHLFLLILGGTENGYVATLKAYLYSTGPNVLSIVPCIGPFVGSIWSIVSLVFGITTLQKVSGIKAVSAVFLLPLLICCCCIGFIIIFAVIFALFFGGMSPNILQEFLRIN